MARTDMIRRLRSRHSPRRRSGSSARTIQASRGADRRRADTAVARQAKGVYHRCDPGRQPSPDGPATGRRPDYWATIGEWLRTHGVVRN